MTSRQAPHLGEAAPYLRDLRDLTIHASIDCEGELVVLPVFNTLGSQAPLRHAGVCGMYAKHPLYTTFTAQHGLREATTAHFTYPALTPTLPLPAPAVIDHTLSTFDDSAPQEAAHIRAQLRSAAQQCSLRFFIGTGYECEDPALGCDSLAQMVAAQPGILSPPAVVLLAALSKLLTAVDAAAAEHRFLLMNASDLTFVLRLPALLKTPFEYRLAKPSWSGFYHDLRTQQGDLAEHLAAVDQRLVSRLSLSRLIALCQRSKAPFVVVPDVGEAALLQFVGEAHRAVGALGVKYQEMRVKLDEPQRPRRSTEAGSGVHVHVTPSRYTELFTAAWGAVLGRAAAARFYADDATTVAALAAAWGRRYADDGAYSTLQRYMPSRPIAAGGAVIAQPESGAGGIPMVRLTPAVPRPEVAAQKSTAKRQQDSTASARLWLKLGDLGGISQTQPLTPSPTAALAARPPVQVLWPQAELWQTVDMVKTLAAFPAFLLHPEILTQGCAAIDRSAWEAVAWPEDGIYRDLPAGKPWPTTHAWFFGATPWPIGPKESVKRALYHDKTTSAWSMTLVDAGISAGQVRLSVRYAVVGSSAELDAKLQLAQVLQGLQNARTVPSELQAAFAQLGESLRFEARPYFEVDGHAVTEADWFAAVKVGALSMRLPNGLAVDVAVYLAKSEQFLLRQKVYAKFTDLTYSQLWQVHRQATEDSVKNLLPEEYVEQLGLQVAPVLQRLDQQLTADVTAMLQSGALRTLAPQLRQYQQSGVAWGFLRLQLGLGICLADEMGLGKTIQAMALLLALRSPDRPSLVVMPKSVMVNWQRELARFAPELKVRLVEDTAPAQDSDVWLISYPRLRLGVDWIQAQEFQLVVLDEAQAIKNSDSQTTEAAGRLQARHRLALTGTPVENHAGELWSLVHWLNPGYLGRVADFMNYIKLARSSAQKRLLLAPLKSCLEPIMLRRTKADPQVQIGLPPKVFQDHLYDFSAEQTALYEALLEVVFTEEVTGLSAASRRALFLKAILHAKQICVHPELFYGDEEDLTQALAGSASEVLGAMDGKRFRAQLQQRVRKLAATVDTGSGAWLRRSGKFAALGELLPDLLEVSRGILLFTQYRGSARLLQQLLLDAGHGGDAVPFLHGGLSMQARQSLVDDFNDACLSKRPTAPVLILSLKAGGTGLNLTGADRVIHVDRWWNPAVEDQATDRAHRMGQDSTVFVHTLTGQATIEESISRIFLDKRRLADDLLGGAELGAVGNLLGSTETFLDLMDPQRVFCKRLIAAGVPLQLGKGNKAR